MNSINLLPKKSLDEGKLLATRNAVKMITSIALVVYIVLVSGLVGWWLFVASVDSITTRELADLESQVKQNSAVEALVRQADSRQQLISTFLTEKQSVSSLSAKLIPLNEGIAISSWKYDGSVNTLIGNVQQLAEAEKYTERLKNSFPHITISTLTIAENSIWTTNIKL